MLEASLRWVSVRVSPGVDVGSRDACMAALFAVGAQGVHEDGTALVTHFPPSTDLEAVHIALTEADIQQLVVHDKWLATLNASLSAELDRVSQTLTRRIRELAERYAKVYPKVAMVVQAGGSLAGLLALKRGTIDIAAMSRDLTEEEDTPNARAHLVAINEHAHLEGCEPPMLTYR